MTTAYSPVGRRAVAVWAIRFRASLNQCVESLHFKSDQSRRFRVAVVVVVVAARELCRMAYTT